MKRLMILVVAILLVAALTVPAFAIMSGERVFETKMGDITFSAAKHKAAGITCKDCHDKIFEKKKGSVSERMPKKHIIGKGCGACHKQVDDKTQCTFCHKK